MSNAINLSCKAPLTISTSFMPPRPAAPAPATQPGTTGIYGADAFRASVAGQRAFERVETFAGLGNDAKAVQELSDRIRPLLDKVSASFGAGDPLRDATIAVTDKLWRARNGEGLGQATSELTAEAIGDDLGELFALYEAKLGGVSPQQRAVLQDVMKGVGRELDAYTDARAAQDGALGDDWEEAIIVPEFNAPAAGADDYKAKYEALLKANADRQHAEDEAKTKPRLEAAIAQYTSLMHNAGAVERAAAPLRDAALAAHDALPEGFTLIRQQLSTLAEEMNRVGGDGDARSMDSQDLAKKLRLVMDTVTAKMDGLPYDGAEWKALDGFRQAIIQEGGKSASRGDVPRAFIEFWKE